MATENEQLKKQRDQLRDEKKAALKELLKMQTKSTWHEGEVTKMTKLKDIYDMLFKGV